MPRLLLCLATTAIAGLLAWGAEAERLFGTVAQPSVTYRVDVPTAAFDQLSPRAIEDTWRARLRAYDVRTRPAPTDRPDAVGVYVEVIGADPDADAPDALADALTGSAHFRIVAVVDGSPAMAAWGAAVEAAPEAFAEVSAQPDSWRGPDGRDRHDTFLAAPSRAALERAVTALTAQHPLPEGTHIAYEEVITPFPPDGGPRPRPYVRTYLVDDAAVLAGEDIVNPISFP